MKNILIILGHPLKNSFCGALAKNYSAGTRKKGNKVRFLNLGDLKFNPLLKKGYKEIQKLEPDLIKAQKDIQWANHLVWIFPVWWGSFPALMKGFIDRTFLPGFAFKYVDDFKWKKYFKGKSARMVMTMDSFPWYYKIFIREPASRALRTTLSFCGVKPIKKTYFGSIMFSSKEKRKKWLRKIKVIGEKD
jgi:NAD(P)H dehydrogenase (quinone)